MTLPASYSTVENVLTLVSAVRSVSSIDSAAVAYFIGRAQAQVEARLGSRYELPFGGPPPIIETITTEIAAYEILRRIFSQQRMNKSEWPDSFKDTGAQLLEGLAKGTSMVITASGTSLSGRNDLGEVWASSSAYLPTFDEGDLGFWQLDPFKERAIGFSRLVLE